MRIPRVRFSLMTLIVMVNVAGVWTWPVYRVLSLTITTLGEVTTLSGLSQGPLIAALWIMAGTVVAGALSTIYLSGLAVKHIEICIHRKSRHILPPDAHP
jgi:hypothetical protein